MGFIIRPENSVPRYAKVTISVSPFIKFCIENGCTSIIDIGTGRFRNLKPLLLNFKKVWAEDTKLQQKRISHLIEKIKSRSFQGFIDEEKFATTRLNASCAMIVCVLHIVPPKTRLKILQSTQRNLRKNGFLLVDIPYAESYYKPLMKKSNRHLDGYVMGDRKVRTFHKEFTKKQVLSLVSKYGFDVIKDLKLRHHHAIICKKS